MYSDDLKLGRVFKIIGISNDSQFKFAANHNHKDSPIGLEVTVDPSIVIVRNCSPYCKIKEDVWQGYFIVTKGNVNWPPGLVFTIHGAYVIDVGPVNPERLQALINSVPAQRSKHWRNLKVRLY